MKTEEKVLLRSALDEFFSASEAAEEAFSAAVDKLTEAAKGDSRLEALAAHVASRAKAGALYASVTGTLPSLARKFGVARKAGPVKKKSKPALTQPEKVKRKEPETNNEKKKEG